MAKSVVKQGHFGLGRPLVKWYCDKCGAECQNQFSSGSLMYCRSCANAVDPDIVHMWPREEIARNYMGDEFFTDTHDGQRKLIESCNRCLGLLVICKQGEQFQRTYFRIGSRTGTKTNFPCVDHPGYDVSGNVLLQTDCEHEFQIIGTSKRLDKEAHAKYENMLAHRNREIEAMYGSDEIDLQYHCFGRTVFWCFKCGLVRSLNPQREHLLPRNGLSHAKWSLD